MEVFHFTRASQVAGLFCVKLITITTLKDFSYLECDFVAHVITFGQLCLGEAILKAIVVEEIKGGLAMKNVLIVGAGHGIGLALVKNLLSSGEDYRILATFRCEKRPQNLYL